MSPRSGSSSTVESGRSVVAQDRSRRGTAGPTRPSRSRSTVVVLLSWPRATRPSWLGSSLARSWRCSVRSTDGMSRRTMAQVLVRSSRSRPRGGFSVGWLSSVAPNTCRSFDPLMPGPRIVAGESPDRSGGAAPLKRVTGVGSTPAGGTYSDRDFTPLTSVFACRGREVGVRL